MIKSFKRWDLPEIVIPSFPIRRISVAVGVVVSGAAVMTAVDGVADVAGTDGPQVVISLRCLPLFA